MELLCEIFEQAKGNKNYFNKVTDMPCALLNVIK